MDTNGRVVSQYPVEYGKKYWGLKSRFPIHWLPRFADKLAPAYTPRGPTLCLMYETELYFSIDDKIVLKRVSYLGQPQGLILAPLLCLHCFCSHNINSVIQQFLQLLRFFPKKIAIKVKKLSLFNIFGHIFFTCTHGQKTKIF